MRYVCCKKRALAFLLALWLLLGPVLAVVHRAEAKELKDIEIEVVYYQSEARSVVNLINELRASDDAWAWQPNNVDKYWYKEAGPIHYDYSLEKIAMQRAAEAAFYFDHKRPDGSDSITCKYDGAIAWAENLGDGQGSAKDIFDAWCETRNPYETQGHRRQMLRFSNVGIAHVYAHGSHYWAAVFSSTNSGTPETPAVNGSMKRTIRVDFDFLGTNRRWVSINYPGYDGIFLNVSREQELPKTTYRLYNRFLTGTWPGQDYIDAITLVESQYAVTWRVEDPTVAKIDGNKVVGMKEGITRLVATMTYHGVSQEAGIDLKVRERDISKASLFIYFADLKNGVPLADWTVARPNDPTFRPEQIGDRIYTGAPITLHTGVLYHEISLIQGTDYEVLYKDNILPGKATIIIRGIGDFYGQREYTFQIVQPDNTPTPTLIPTKTPTPTVGNQVTNIPTTAVTQSPIPSMAPTVEPMLEPIEQPTGEPIEEPTQGVEGPEDISPEPTEEPTIEPTIEPPIEPTISPEEVQLPTFSPAPTVDITNIRDVTTYPELIENTSAPAIVEPQVKSPLPVWIFLAVIVLLILICLFFY